MTRQEERSLIRRINAGEPELFELLVVEHQKIVYNLALRMLRHPEDAQDCAQEAFIKAYRSLPLFRGDAAFSSWLYRLTTNVCLDFLRKKKRREELSLTFEDEQAQPLEYAVADERFDPQQELEKKELRRAVRQGLEELPEDFRQVILLREVAGLSYEEIGRQLSLEPGTVKSRLFRARKKLAQYLTAGGNISVRSASEGKEVR